MVQLYRGCPPNGSPTDAWQTRLSAIDAPRHLCVLHRQVSCAAQNYYEGSDNKHAARIRTTNVGAPRRRHLEMQQDNVHK